MSKASKEKMDSLHDALADVLLRAVTEGETVLTKEGIDTVSPRPGTLAVAAKFLKDNGVAGVDAGTGRLNDLADKISAMIEENDDLKAVTEIN